MARGGISNIKSLAPRKDSIYKQDYYKIQNPNKYIGDHQKCIFRSSWEKRFMIHCDTSDKILLWSSEPVAIPYFNPINEKQKPYNVDFYAKVVYDNGLVKQFLIEVKPLNQLEEPKRPTKKSEKAWNSYCKAMETFIVNTAKFNAAKIYAEQRGMEFIIVSENFIF